MNRVGIVFGAALMLGVLGGSARSAQAQAKAPTPLPGIEYRADAGCPSLSRFRAAVARLAPELAERSFSAVRVGLVAEPTGFTGTLQVADTSRSVHAAACPDAAHALALILVITLDPDAEVSRGEVTARDFEEPAPAADPAAPAPAAAAKEQPKKAVPRRQNPTQARPAEAPSAPALGVWIVQLGPALTLGELQGVSLGGGLALSHRGRWFEGFELGLETVLQERALGNFELAAVRISGKLSWCPELVGAPHGWGLFGCAGASLGVLRAELEQSLAAQAQGAQVAFSAQALAGLAVYAPLGSGLGLLLRADALLPLTRSRLVVATERAEDAAAARDATLGGALHLRLSYEL